MGAQIGSICSPSSPKAIENGQKHESGEKRRDDSPQYETSILVYVNGQKHVLQNVHPHKTLQDFLHEIGLTGTKVSCAQGACGACTVAVARWVDNHVEQRAVNACLRPLLLCDGNSVTTVEGIGSATKPHPVQERIAGLNGSQCGYCTPGQVMSMYSLLQENKKPTPQEVEACLDGNICRCTGYRGIHAAFHTFAGKEATTVCDGFKTNFADYKASGADNFPSELQGYKLRPLFVQDPAGQTKWHRVKDLDEWATICLNLGMMKPRVVVGSTSVGVFGHKIGKITNVDVSAIAELRGWTKAGDGAMVVGGAETLTTLICSLKSGNAAQQTLAGALSKIANTGIRNAGGWAGNLVMGRVPYFPSDGAVLLSAFGASVSLAVAQNGQVARKDVSVSDFVKDNDLNNVNYVLISIKIPAIADQFHAIRQSFNKVNGHAIVNAAFRCEVSGTGESKSFKSASIYVGCVGKRAMLLEDASSFLKGKALNETTLQGLLDIVHKLQVEPDATYVTWQQPNGKDAYRKQLVAGFVFKWFVSLMPLIPKPLRSIEAPSGGFWEGCDQSLSVAQTMTSTAQLNLPTEHPGTTYAGPKKEAMEQACGQTRYSGDMPMGPRGVHGVYVTAPKVGKLMSTDVSEAAKQDGFVAFLTFKDVPGMNSASLIPGDEPVFVEDGADILYAGAPVGLLVATTHQLAKTLSRMVKVNIGERTAKPIFTIDEAIAAKNFLYGPDFPGKKVDVGNVEAAFADPNNVVMEGEYMIGGQNNFYLERNTAIAMPDDMGRIAVWGGAQCPADTQTRVMMALGCASKDVVVKVRPMGGAFGGKFTRQFSVFCISAVACKVLGRPVRVAQNLQQCMGMQGHTRHIVKCNYKVAATRAGKIVAYETNVFIDAGCSNDYSDYIADEIVKRQDGAYDLPNYRGCINMVKTNNPTASAVRAPGLAQAAAIGEHIIDKLARKLSIPQETIRELSLKPMKNPKDQTGQAMLEWNTPLLWADAKKKWAFAERERSHKEFNEANRFKKRATAMMPLKYAVGYANMSGGTVTVNINAVDGTVAIQTGCCEMGQGCLTKVLSTCATELGIPIEKVSGYYPDTSVIPNHATDGGSAGGEILCNATKLACAELKKRLEPVEKELLEERRAAEPDKKHEKPSLAEVVARAQGPMPTDTRTLLSATASYKLPKWNDLKRSPEHPPPPLPWWNHDPVHDDIWQYYVTGVGMSDVEVDVLTGDYTILRSDINIDAGHSLNPLIDLGQAEGGFVFGIGTYCREEILMDPTDGRNKSEGTWNYKPPSNKDVPQIFNVNLAAGNKSSRTAYGSKGIGECPLLLAYTVVSALNKAILASRLERGLSADFTLHSPATPDRVQQCMGLRPSDFTMR